jgi:hypothetical protein
MRAIVLSRFIFSRNHFCHFATFKKSGVKKKEKSGVKKRKKVASKKAVPKIYDKPRFIISKHINGTGPIV